MTKIVDFYALAGQILAGWDDSMWGVVPPSFGMVTAAGDVGNFASMGEVPAGGRLAAMGHVVTGWLGGGYRPAGILYVTECHLVGTFDRASEADWLERNGGGFTGGVASDYPGASAAVHLTVVSTAGRVWVGNRHRSGPAAVAELGEHGIGTAAGVAADLLHVAVMLRALYAELDSEGVVK